MKALNNKFLIKITSEVTTEDCNRVLLAVKSYVNEKLSPFEARSISCIATFLNRVFTGWDSPSIATSLKQKKLNSPPSVLRNRDCGDPKGNNFKAGVHGPSIRGSFDG